MAMRALLFSQGPDRSRLMAELNKHVFNNLNMRGQSPIYLATENEIDYSLTVSWNTIQTM